MKLLGLGCAVRISQCLHQISTLSDVEDININYYQCQKVLPINLYQVYDPIISIQYCGIVKTKVCSTLIEEEV